MRSAFIDTLLELAQSDPDVCLITADMGFSVVEKFANAFPDRFLNVGVAEADMLAVATGMARDGWIPYVYSIATFASMRGFEQFRNGPVMHGLPVRVVGIGGGFAYGHAGLTHYALEDFALMRSQPGVVVYAPADPAQTRALTRATVRHPGPIYLRIGKGNNAPVPGLSVDTARGFDVIGEGAVAIVTTGSMSPSVVRAAEELKASGIAASAIIVSRMQPAPDGLAAALGGFKCILSVEEHYLHGGLGSLVAELLAERGHPARFKRLAVTGLPTGRGGGTPFLLQRFGLDVPSIVREAVSLVRA